jgi:hypothetical protein
MKLHNSSGPAYASRTSVEFSLPPAQCYSGLCNEMERRTDPTSPSSCIWTGGWEQIWSKSVVSNYNSGILFGGLRKSTENLSKGIITRIIIDVTI